VEKKNYIPTWKLIKDANELKKEVTNRSTAMNDAAAIRNRLCAHNVFFVASANSPAKGQLLYFSFMFKGVLMLLEVTLNKDVCSIIIKSENPTFAAIAMLSIVNLLST